MAAGERKTAANRYRLAADELEMLVHGKASNGSDFYTYRYLATEGFLPGYNFPRLPLYAFVPATRGAAVLQRPRFLAISEFGPNSLVYHEGRAFRITKAKLPAGRRAVDGNLATDTVILCSNCGAAESSALMERCRACGNPLAGAERLDSVFRIDNVETFPTARITANDEDRQRRGFEIQTVFTWTGPKVHSVQLISDTDSLATLSFGRRAKITRLNKGLKRRAEKSICGFVIDPLTGRWLADKNNDDGNGADPGKSRQQRIVPVVEDHKNSLLLIPDPSLQLDVSEMAILQHALVRAIEISESLEEGEMLGDGPWFLSVQHNGVARELDAEKAEPCARGHVAAFAFTTRDALFDAVRRAYELALSLPTLPLEKFKAEVDRIGATERDAVIRQRVGQDIFRETLLVYWRNTCPLTGITDPELLRASHIIRWADCPNDEERLNVHNGLLLSSLWDAAFDSGLITFDDNGKAIPARALSRSARAEMRIEEAPKVMLVDATRERMAWHRKNVFQDRK